MKAAYIFSKEFVPPSKLAHMLELIADKINARIVEPSGTDGWQILRDEPRLPIQYGEVQTEYFSLKFKIETGFWQAPKITYKDNVYRILIGIIRGVECDYLQYDFLNEFFERYPDMILQDSDSKMIFSPDLTRKLKESGDIYWLYKGGDIFVDRFD
ncbi:hypothetical protein [Larkinella sp.]|uniref:hypothetical protein n=1 Tax=Larkinella sp. TaxID=2034517 RepID=UPI003BAB5681